MIKYKTKEEIKKMERAGKMAARLLEYIAPHVRVGISTEALDEICQDWIESHQLISACLNYKGFPKSICTSLNHVVCHGIPKKEDVLRKGDILNIDVTVIVDGYHGDTSKTFMVDKVDKKTALLVDSTKTALEIGIAAVSEGAYLNDIGRAIESFVRPLGYSIVKELGGHGIGKKFHESPFVFHHYQKEKGVKLREGMTFTIEPMINQGEADIFIDDTDGWTVYTQDFSLSAQFEHTVLVKKNGVEILTIC